MNHHNLPALLLLLLLLLMMMMTLQLLPLRLLPP
jgi:hypothetical protein